MLGLLTFRVRGGAGEEEVLFDLPYGIATAGWSQVTQSVTCFLFAFFFVVARTDRSAGRRAPSERRHCRHGGTAGKQGHGHQVRRRRQQQPD